MSRLAVPADEAEEKAEFVLDFFGFEDRVLDNVLEPPDRQLFYALQQSGLLTTRSEENALHNGQSWRTHYWLMRADRVLEAAAAAERRAAPDTGTLAEGGDVYAELPSECWTRH